MRLSALGEPQQRRCATHSKWLWLAVALTAVLGITATASGKLPTLITGKQIAPHQINSAHLVNHTIQAHDLSTSLIASLRGQQGATGATGATGDTGPKGDTGQQGPRGTTDGPA